MASKEALKWKILDLEQENDRMRVELWQKRYYQTGGCCENLQRHFDALASSHQKMQKKLAGINEILHLDNP